MTTWVEANRRTDRGRELLEGGDSEPRHLEICSNSTFGERQSKMAVVVGFNDRLLDYNVVVATRESFSSRSANSPAAA